MVFVARAAAGDRFPPITAHIAVVESFHSAFRYLHQIQKPPWDMVKQRFAFRAGSCASSSSPAPPGPPIGSEALPLAYLPKSSGARGGTGQLSLSYAQRSSR